MKGLIRVALICGFVGLALNYFAGSVVAAGGVPVLLDFENMPVGTAVHSFPGLDLVTYGSSNYDGSPHFTIIQPSLGTVSGTHALQSHFDTGGEFSGTHLTMAFSIPQSLVTLSTGLVSPSSGPGATFLLQGFDKDPNSAGGASPIAQAVGLCLGNSPTPVTNPLQLIDPSSRTYFAVLSLVACDRPTESASGATNATIVVDNLSYERGLNPPAHESIPPIISIVDPQNGATVTGGAPQEIVYRVNATVQESDLDRVTVTVNGQAGGLASFFSSGTNAYNASILLTSSQGLVAGNNTVVMSARDFDNPPNSASATVTFYFRPKPTPPASQVDFWPTAFEVTQTIDTGPHLLGDVYTRLRGYEVYFGSLFDVPLIKGKPALIRIFGAASGTKTAVNPVPAVMNVSLDGCTSNCTLANGLPPMQGWLAPGAPSPNLRGITVAPFGAPGSSVNSLASTWNFFLPSNWTQQNLVVDMWINNGSYSGFPQQPSQPECSVGTSGLCFNNNEVKLHLPFRSPNELVVNPVFVHVTGSYRGQTYNDAQASQTQFDGIVRGLNELYPMNVLAGVRKDITVSPDISNDDLLDAIDDASGTQPCYAIAAGPNVWLGLFPSDQAKGAGFAANNGGVLGTANLGSESCAVPAAWANADSLTSAAHEIGHTIGFDHWGCEHQGDEECRVFPIPHGGTGSVGIDIVNFRVVPEDTSSAPFHTHDFMVTFVDPSSKWVSWYTYEILMDHSSFSSYDASDPPALIVRGSISVDGVATLRPAYQIDVPQPITDTVVEDDASDIYTIRGFDAEGNTIVIHNFEPQKRDRHDPMHRQAFEFTEAIPATQNLQRLAIFKGSREIGALRSSGAPIGSFEVRAPVAGSRWSRGTVQTIRWTTPNPRLVAMVEFSRDGGKTRTLLGRDIRGTSLSVKSDELPSSQDAMIFVQLTDGLRTADVSSPVFIVDPKPPTAHIIIPRTGAQAIVGLPLSLFGSGFDRDETLDESGFRWSSNRDGLLGTGFQLDVSHLSVGDHMITLTVTNHRGLSSTDSVTVRVTTVSARGGQPTPGPNVVAIGLAAVAILLLVLLVTVRRRRS